MTRNTLELLLSLLNGQQIRVGAPREEIDAVLAARDELEKALGELSDPTST